MHLEDNRDLFIEHAKSVNALVLTLSSDNPDVVYTACGAILNTSMDNETLQIVLIANNAMKELTRIIRQSTRAKEFSNNTCGMAIRAISNLVETGLFFNFILETGLNEFLSSETLLVMFELVKKFRNLALRQTLADEVDSVYVLEGLVIVLETIAEFGLHIFLNVDAAQFAIVENNLLDILFEFVDFRSPDTDIEIAENSPTSYASVRIAISKIVTNITMCDRLMDRLANNSEVLNKFKQWMIAGFETGTINREEPIRMAGALCIGNLARSGNCF
jgi:hypothetical protein